MKFVEVGFWLLFVVEKPLSLIKKYDFEKIIIDYDIIVSSQTPYDFHPEKVTIVPSLVLVRQAVLVELNRQTLGLTDTQTDLLFIY